MKPKWLKVASRAQKMCILYIFRSLVHSLVPKDNILTTFYTVFCRCQHKRTENLDHVGVLLNVTGL